MLARLQTAIALSLLALAAAWLVFTLPDGRWLAAALGLLLLGGGHALVLGLECLLVARVNRHDPAPAASVVQWLRAWWGEVRSAPVVFCWRQPFFSHRFPDCLPEAARGRRGVLLVHGFVCNRGVWNPWLQRLQQAGVPFIAVNLEPVFGAIDDHVPQLEAAVQQLQQHTGLAPVVVAHSMGGLALRRWWADAGDPGRVHHAITIGTPHHGTWLARFALTPNGRQMRLASRWLLALAAREPAGHGARFTCFYGHCDNIVFPPATATLPGADNRHLPGVAHVHMVDRPAPWAEALQRLARPAS
jgi:triacylglycerol lipase